MYNPCQGLYDTLLAGVYPECKDDIKDYCHYKNSNDILTFLHDNGALSQQCSKKVT